MRRPTATETSLSSSLAARNRRAWTSSRTKARITRIPAICSRITWLIRSIRVCTRRNRGRMGTMTPTIAATSSGTTTSSSPDRRTSSRSARATPPTMTIGADSAIVRVMRTSIWTCWTSFVVLVMSECVPKTPTSRAEKVCTRSKTPARTSRPKPMAVRAAK
jgi:hypothetical protein